MYRRAQRNKSGQIKTLNFGANQEKEEVNKGEYLSIEIHTHKHTLTQTKILDVGRKNKNEKRKNEE